MNPTNKLPSDNKMRAAIAARDKAFDGRFVYAVITTGVFCRPSCSSRPARPENVRFYPANSAAIEAGYRPCKRCRPDEDAAGVAPMVELARFIETHADELLTLATLGKRAGLSPSRLQHVFKATFGVTPKQYQDAARGDRLKELLKSADGIAEAIFAAGYGSTSRVYGEASRNVGMTPGAYRAGGAGETIDYACRTSVLGPLLMAATQRGVCFAQFGDSQRELLEQLKSEFPNAQVRRSAAADAPDLDAWVDALDKHLGTDAPRPELPLDLRGTAFQIRVWRFLLGVAAGDVVSYSEVATGIGKPKAVRAAASACGANRVAVLVPCHRVLRSDGGLGGYRWGIERKRALLDAERRRRTST